LDAVFVENPKVASGEAVLLHAPLNATLPETEGLVAAPVGVDPEGRGIWKLTGKDGSYILTIPVGEPPVVHRLFIDIGVVGPSGGELEDLQSPPPPPAPLWPYVLTAASATAVSIFAARYLLKKLVPPPAPAPPDPPHLIALREWAALRARTDLTPEALALALSEVYRRYLEATHGWPATSRTTREILDNLAHELTGAQTEQAKRLLSAMDLIKFADRSTHTGFFEALDADFHMLVGSRA
jgi:hypothetical protein